MAEGKAKATTTSARRTPAAKAAAPVAAAAKAPIAEPKASAAVKPDVVTAKPVTPAPKAVAETPKAPPVAEKPQPPVAAKAAPAAVKPAPVAPKTESAPKAQPAVTPAASAIAAEPKGMPEPAAKPSPAPEVKPETAKQQVAPIAASAGTKGTSSMNEAINKAQETTQKLAADGTARVQAMFGEASERAKGAYEKGIKATEEFTEFSKGNVEALVESSKLAAKAVETLGQEAADYARKSFENSTAAFKTFASAKSPTELFKLQSDYLKSSFDSAVAESSKVTEAWLKLAGEIVQPVSNRFAVAMEKARTTATF
jgi:phasin family protein